MDYFRGVRPGGVGRCDGAVRDASGASGPSGFRLFPSIVGSMSHAAGCAGLLETVVAALCRRQTMAVLMEGMESAFANYSGAPKKLQFDQMRSVVIVDERTGGCRCRRNTLITVQSTDFTPSAV